MFRALAELMDRWGANILVVDDVHWADPASLDLLRFLSRRVATLPLLLLATYRDDEVTRRHSLYHLLPTLVDGRPNPEADRLDSSGNRVRGAHRRGRRSH